MRKLETIEIYREKTKQCDFDYQIKHLTVDEGYRQIEKTNDYAKLTKHITYCGD